MRTSTLSFVLASAIASVGLLGCGDDPRTSGGGGGGGNPPEEFALIGSWTSNFGNMEVITSTSWNNGFSTDKVLEFKNDIMTVYTQTSSGAQFNPDRFNKIEWSGLTDNSFYYCIVDFGLATLAEAKTSTQTGDTFDPDNSGCGSFPWTKLTK